MPISLASQTTLALNRLSTKTSHVKEMLPVSAVTAPDVVVFFQQPWPDS